MVMSTEKGNYALTGGTVFDGERFLPGHAVLVRGELVRAIVPEADVGPLESVCVNGRIIAPAFVDAQVNGCGGVLFNDAPTAQTLDQMHAANLRGGCAAFLPALVSTDDATMLRAMEAVRQYRAARGPLPVLGLHLEGPYISRQRRGIHDAAMIRPLDAAMRAVLADFAAGTPLLLTLAPECVSPEDIRILSGAGAIVSLGHSAASHECVRAAVAAGARAATHLFNGMEPLSGREPGLLGAALHSPELACGLLADGFHVHFANLDLARRLKGEACFFVTDATAPVGTDMLSFPFCGQTVYVKDGRCLNADGTLGGSLLTMIRAVENGAARLGWDLGECLRMASLYPARLLGLEDRLGRIAPGRPACLTVFSPETWTVAALVDRGVLRVAGQGL